MNNVEVHQVISFNCRAHLCRDQIKHLGYFDTKKEADIFAKKQNVIGEIIVRKSLRY